MEAISSQRVEAFPRWLRDRCSRLGDGEGGDMEFLRSLSNGPSRRVCSFRSMTAYGSHYRIEEGAGGATHVTYDCGVAELGARGIVGGRRQGRDCVEIVRVGTLKDILVLNYTNTNLVLMLVSWLTKDTELQPRLRRDAHGFWLANMQATPRCTQNPYILPSLASQVTISHSQSIVDTIRLEMCIGMMGTADRGESFCAGLLRGRQV